MRKKAKNYAISCSIEKFLVPLQRFFIWILTKYSKLFVWILSKYGGLFIWILLVTVH